MLTIDSSDPMASGVDVSDDVALLMARGEEDTTLLRCREEGTPSPMIIKNCVATAYFGTSLDLEELSWKKHGEFNPSSFAAAIFRLQTPATTALIFASGMVVCCGAPSEASALVAITKYYRMVADVSPYALCLNVAIQNIVGTGHLGHHLNLDTALEWLQSQGYMNGIYDPELFPGLRFVPKDVLRASPVTKVMVFSEGNVVICGAKTKEDLRVSWLSVREILLPFACEKKVRFRFDCLKAV